MNGYKVFKLQYGSVNELKLFSDIEFIRIGEEGRGRRVVRIPVISGVGSGAWRVKRTDRGVVIVEVDDLTEPPAPCIGVVNCVGGYSRRRSYPTPEVEGFDVLASGTVAFGAAGRVNGGEEVLAIIQPGTEFFLNRKYCRDWYTWTGDIWIVETPSERRSRLALQEVRDGGGEWL